MTTKTIKIHICDRCGERQEGEPGRDFNSGYASFGPTNGANDEHVGMRQGGKTDGLSQHADLCEDCRCSLLNWWRNPPIEQDKKPEWSPL